MWLKYVYAGLRVSTKNKRLHLFVNCEDYQQELLFTDRGDYALGCVYKVQHVENNPERFYPKSIEFVVDVNPHPELVNGWMAKNLEAIAHFEKIAHARNVKTLEKKHSKKLEDYTLKELNNLVSYLTPSQRRAILNIVINKIL